jgi:hypothetical protein
MQASAQAGLQLLCCKWFAVMDLLQGWLGPSHRRYCRLT